MIFPLITLLLFISSAGALATGKRDISTAASTLIQDIQNIDTGVKALTTSIHNFQGGNIMTTLIDGTPVTSGIAAIHIANRKGFLDANLSPTLSASDSDAIVTFAERSVGVDIPASVDALKAKKARFVAAGLGGVTIASLELLLNDHDTFSAALLAKTTGDASLEARGIAVVKKIHDAIQGGIDYYSS